MNRTIVAKLARPLLISICVAAVLIIVVRIGSYVLRKGPVLGPFAALLPFVAAAVCVVGLGVMRPGIDRLVGRLTHLREVRAGLLLRCVALNAEVAERIRWVDGLAAEFEASRQRLARAREVERRRLIMELGHAPAERLAALRTEVLAARADLDPGRERADRVKDALERACVGLDDLTDRFRMIARGVYPAVLRDQGPVAALDELAADLPRPVRLTGELSRRLAWEIESGIYYVAACAVQQLAGRPAERELLVHFDQTPGRLSVRIEDAAPAVAAEELRGALAGDRERLAALGGDLDLTDEPAVGAEGAAPGRLITLRAWLPDRLEPPLVDSSAVVAEVR